MLNTKFPEIGELLLHRLLKQWVRAYTRNDKPIILAVSKFIAHLVNQQVQPAVKPMHSMRLFLHRVPRFSQCVANAVLPEGHDTVHHPADHRSDSARACLCEQECAWEAPPVWSAFLNVKVHAALNPGPCHTQVVHELLVLELLLTLLEKPSDSSIEVAVSLAKETGAFLQDVAPGPANQCAPASFAFLLVLISRVLRVIQFIGDGRLLAGRGARPRQPVRPAVVPQHFLV